MKRPLFIANWKMHKTAAETQLFARQFEKPEAFSCGVVVCAPFTALHAIAPTWFGLGAQNFYPQDQGAFTGEISLPMLKELGVQYVITGHSERRQLFHESDEWVAKKYHYAARHGMTPVLCLGEPETVRLADNAQAYCALQLEAVFGKTDKQNLPATIIVAYEPVWAIGSGQTATPEDAQEMCGHLRKALASWIGEAAAQEALFLYGGSVKPENIETFMQQPDIDGALVGGASLEAADFTELIQKGCSAGG